MSEAFEVTPEDLSASNPPIPESQAQITIERYGNRFLAVYDGGQLLCVCVYKRGAKAVQSRLRQHP